LALDLGPLIFLDGVAPFGSRYSFVCTTGRCPVNDPAATKLSGVERTEIFVWHVVMKLIDCIICKLLSGELPVSMVYQDDRCSAFMDIQPVNAGHMLVVPNIHAASLADLEAEDGAQMFRVAQRLAAVLRTGVVRCEGVNLFMADGAAAGQDIFHAHLHVFPRYAEDGFGLTLPPTYSEKPSRLVLNDLAKKIEAGLR